MFSTRSFIALTVGLGLSLSACMGETNSDSDIADEGPDMQPMGGGSGYNGGFPAAVGPCINGIALAAWSVRGTDANNTVLLNPQLDKYRCAGYIDSSPYTASNLAADAPNNYVNRPINVARPNEGNEIVESMVWAGVTRNVEVDTVDPITAITQQDHGRGFLATPWETTPIPTTNELSNFISLVVAKMNAFKEPVALWIESKGIVAEDPQGDYTVPESIIVSHYSVNNKVPAGEILFFKADLPYSECRDANAYYKERTCHDGQTSCVPGLEVLTMADLPAYCTRADGTPAQSFYDQEIKCLGQPAFKVWVRPGGLLMPGSVCSP